MSDYVGVINLKQAIPCQKDVSGKTFKSKIANHEVLIVFPSLPDDYSFEKEPDFINGDLVPPCNWFEGRVNWGTIHKWPDGVFSTQNLLCYISGNETEIHKIYAKFPYWKKKISDLVLIKTGDYLLPEQEIPAIVRGGGISDGLQIFEIAEGKRLVNIHNCRNTDPIKVKFVSSEEAYTARMLEDMFAFAGDDKEIALSYELLISAYQAMRSNDFRSAVILGGGALEQAILIRMRREYPSNTKFKRAKKSQRYSMLSGRFNWLLDFKILIPIIDYKKTIIDVRNDAAHDGIRPTYEETKRCLENCKILIETYNPDVLAT